MPQVKVGIDVWIALKVILVLYVCTFEALPFVTSKAFPWFGCSNPMTCILPMAQSSLFMFMLEKMGFDNLLPKEETMSAIAFQNHSYIKIHQIALGLDKKMLPESR